MSAYQLYNTALSIEALESSVTPQPVTNILKYKGFPQAARQRELTKEATRFAGNAVHFFCHHITPVLQARCKALLATGARRKKYHKSADLIWKELPQDQTFYWEHHSKLLRQALRDGALSAEQLLQDAGFRDEWTTYRRLAEIAVADYLEIDLPEYVEEATIDNITTDEELAAMVPSVDQFDPDALACAMARMEAMDELLKRSPGQAVDNSMDKLLPKTEASLDMTTMPDFVASQLQGKDPGLFPQLKTLDHHRLDLTAFEDPPPVPVNDVIRARLQGISSRSPNNNLLLDTLPKTFGSVTSRMIYGNFIQLFPYDIVRNAATGKHATALLRQLADLLDAGGKEFFYYYAYPHLWKCIKPTEVDETIAAVAHGLWQFMKGNDKEEWKRASGEAKKLLGDGDIDGLTRLELESSDLEVLKLHGMMRKALREDKMRRLELRELKRELEPSLETE